MKDREREIFVLELVHAFGEAREKFAVENQALGRLCCGERECAYSCQSCQSRSHGSFTVAARPSRVVARAPNTGLGADSACTPWLAGISSGSEKLRDNASKTWFAHGGVSDGGGHLRVELSKPL